MDSSTFERRKSIWEATLMLPNTESLIDSGIKELSEYFGISYTYARDILSKSEQLFAEEWEKNKVNPADNNSVIAFYNNTRFEIFELMDWHINRFDEGPLNYVCVLEIAKKFGFVKYLDYGSGIGSSAILFLRNGLEVTCADISQPLLNFMEYRIKKRKLEVDLVDLKKQHLAKANYDIITCFEVLEHTVKPIRILRSLRMALKNGGLLILNNVQCPKEKGRPMHISRVKLEKKLRYLGFNRLWNLQSEFKKSSNGSYVVVLRKVDRNCFINGLFYLYDSFFPLLLKNFINKLRKNYGSN